MYNPNNYVYFLTWDDFWGGWGGGDKGEVRLYFFYFALLRYYIQIQHFFHNFLLVQPPNIALQPVAVGGPKEDELPSVSKLL